MQNNLATLGFVARDWSSEFQGILLMKDKKSNFSEYWCKLKGNILTFCKSSDDDCVELLGIVVLEYFSFEENKMGNLRHSFKLMFESGDPAIILIAKTNEEYLEWKRHIDATRRNSYVQKIQPLKQNLRLLKRQISDPDNIPDIHDFVMGGTMARDLRGLELKFGGQNLSSYSPEVFPNASVSVFLCDCDTKKDKLYSISEVIQNSPDPDFHKMVFIPESFYLTNFFIRIIVYDVRDFTSNIRVTIGKAEVFIHSLLNNPSMLLKLKNNRNQILDSFLILEVKEHIPMTVSSETPTEYRIYRQMTTNNLTKTYSFPDANNNQMKVVEMMGESIFGLHVPTNYLKKILEEESLLRESLLKAVLSDPAQEDLKNEQLLAMKEVMQKYEDLLSFMSQASVEDKYFLPYYKRSEFATSFIPINLHVNRIYIVHDQNTDYLRNYLDIISVGTFCAHHLKFKGRGLLTKSKNLLQNVSGNSKLTVSNRMLRESVHLVQDISNQLIHMESFLTYPKEIQEDLLDLDVKIERFFEFLHHDYLRSIPQESVRRSYQQLIFRIKEASAISKSTKTGLQSMNTCISKFGRSIEDIGGNVASILWSNIFEVMSTKALILEWRDFMYRENMVLSQILTAVTTGISLACNSWSCDQWSQMISCGIPLYFESFLSTQGQDRAMLEDMIWVSDRIRNTYIIIKPGIKAPHCNLTNTDKMEIICYPESWKRVPMEVRMKQKVDLCLRPFLFNIDLNGKRTIADMTSEEVFSINYNGLEHMKGYIEACAKGSINTARTCKGMEVQDLVKELESDIGGQHVRILRLCQEISWALGSVRFTSCRSAKDETGIALTLEQTRWLKNVGRMKSKCFQDALNCLRSVGLRRDNCYKNGKVDTFAVSTSEICLFQEKYKPPPGTYRSLKIENSSTNTCCISSLNEVLFEK